MSTGTAPTSKEQQLYWQELFQLKADACYIRDYRNSYGKWVTGTSMLRAITSASSIGAWLIWKKFTYLWAALIVASQLVEALKDVFPFYKRRRALSSWCRVLNRLFVEAQRDWDDISSGAFTDARIRKCLHALRLRKGRAEDRYVPNGLTRRVKLFENAQAEAEAFFVSRYNIRSND